MSVPAALETYYDTVPRASADVEQVGPFTLFAASDPDGHPFYARPRLGSTHAFDSDDVALVRARQRELGLPQSLEWVHETTPSLLAAVRSTDLDVHECPLLVLGRAVPAAAPGVTVRVLGPDDDLASMNGAVHAGFGGTDEVVAQPDAQQVRLVDAGLRVVVAAYDEAGTVLGGGSHSPRDGTTELTGIAVLPRARRVSVGAAMTAALVADALDRGVRTVFLSAQDEDVARVYERTGFVRVGTAYIAEPPAVDR